MKRSIRQTFAGVALVFAFQLPSLSAQSASQVPTSTDADFEANLFGGQTDAFATAAGPTPTATASNNFDAEAASGEKAKTEYLVGGSAVVQASSTFTDGIDEYAATSAITGRLFGKVSIPDSGVLYAAATVSHYFVQAAHGAATDLPAADQYTPDIALSELYYGFDAGKKVFFRLGNQLISWGPSLVWSPVDFINLEKEDSFADIDTRTGKSGLKIHVPMPRGNVFFFGDFSRVTSSGFYGDPVKTVNIGGRADVTAGGFEFGFTAYGGEKAQARGGLDFSGRFFGATIYGEAAWAPKYGDWRQWFQSSAGFSRSLGELKNWTLTAEGFYNSKGRDLTGYTGATVAALPADERMSLYQGSWYAYGALKADELFSPSLSTTASALSNLEDGSYLLKLSEAASFPGAVPFTVALTYSGGGKNREFTRYAGNRSFGAKISATLEF